MCVKKDIFKRFYILIDLSTKQPCILGVKADYPLYHQIYEATKSDGNILRVEHINHLGLYVPSQQQQQQQAEVRIYPIEIEKSLF